MQSIPGHVKWLSDTGERLKTADGKTVKVWELSHQTDDTILSEWAAHFRNHYCSDNDIDELRCGTGYTRSEYLENLKFPDRNSHLGPSIRACDFGEILIADLLEFVEGYWVPRTRYEDKAVRDESKKGSDIIGFRIIKEGVYSLKDTLVIFESKTQFSGSRPQKKLQEAVDSSIKDQVRKAESLNAIKQRFLRLDLIAKMKVERFQNPLDHPYKEISGAAALFSQQVFSPEVINKTETNKHPNQNLILIVIRGNLMMELVHELYRRAADEA